MAIDIKAKRWGFKNVTHMDLKEIELKIKYFSWKKEKFFQFSAHKSVAVPCHFNMQLTRGWKCYDLSWQCK